MAKKYNNPILSGFYPDPSICRADNNFYLATSTFAYFPGIPVFHSKDLLHWKQIVSAIDRPGQLCYDGLQISQGLYAPTIRFHDGIFYILCTLVGGSPHNKNFIITAKDPAGPWSDPVWLEGADGIDPSIFFDDDGKVWYCGTHPAPEGEVYPGNYEVYIHEIDLSLLAENKNPLTGKSTGIWRGALRDCIWPEGPHIYKIDGWYYLLHAEGGTGIDHAICIARSKNIHGTWEGKKSNPVLTHRHLGKKAEIINTGHADIIDDTQGNWWMVLLASRPFGNISEEKKVCPLGRETFMIPIYWEDGWPWFKSESGLIEKEYPLPSLIESNSSDIKADWSSEPSCDHFNGKLPLHWLSLRMPVNEKDIAFSMQPGSLRLFTKAATLRGREHPAFAGRRVRHKNWAFSASLGFSPKAPNETAGIVLLQSEDWHYRLELSLSSSGNYTLRLVGASNKEDEVIALCEIPASTQPLVLAARCEEMELSFYCGKDQYSLVKIIDNIDARILSTEYAGGFVGTLAGVFASGNGKDTGNYADVFWAEYSLL